MHVFDAQAVTHNYYSFHSIRKTTFNAVDNGEYKLLGNFVFTIHEEYVMHQRQVYGILDVLGDFGGVLYILMILGSWVMSSFSEFRFNLEAMNRLYLARTKDKIFE